MRISLGLFAFAVTILIATGAVAATVTTEQGEVLVNRGTGFKPAAQPMEVSAGDQVMAKPEGRGNVVYPDGCIVNVVPGVVFTIADKSPCQRRGSHIETAASTAPTANAPGSRELRDPIAPRRRHPGRDHAAARQPAVRQPLVAH